MVVAIWSPRLLELKTLQLKVFFCLESLGIKQNVCILVYDIHIYTDKTVFSHFNNILIWITSALHVLSLSKTGKDFNNYFPIWHSSGPLQFYKSLCHVWNNIDCINWITVLCTVPPDLASVGNQSDIKKNMRCLPFLVCKNWIVLMLFEIQVLFKNVCIQPQIALVIIAVAYFFLSPLKADEKSKHNYLYCCCWKLIWNSLQVCPTSDKSCSHIVCKNPLQTACRDKLLNWLT